jgi:exodeoxyribonuclease V alpha subunit
MKHPSENQLQEVLAGLVERVTYHNAENGFCVLRAKARGHRDVVTVVGHAATIAAGEWITASGEWVNDRTRGQQFKARSCVHRPRPQRTAPRSIFHPA